MIFSTHEELQPTQKTLNLIRQIAYTYRSFQFCGEESFYCLN
mgnify:CR=1 FL=1